MRLLHLGLALTLAAACFADTITLKNGRIINGTYLGGTPREMKVQVGDTIENLDVSQVARIEFGNGNYEPAPNPDRPVLRRNDRSSDEGRPTLRRADSSASNYPPPDSGSGSNDDGRPTLRRTDGPGIMRPGDSASSASTAQSVASSEPVPVSAGTNFVVRMIDSVDSKNATAGQSYAASMAEAVMVNGQTVVPRGAEVVVKLTEAKQSGTFTGKTELTLSLASVKVNGKVIEINTQTVSRESDSRGTKTAETAGGGAVLGAVIGAIAGGGKGAAVGAAAGGAAGAGVQVVTKGERVKIPSETRLTFVLDAPVSI